MTSIIFRELEDAISRAQALETSLKANQNALIRAQVEQETRLRLQSENERGSAQAHERAIQALKNEHREAIVTMEKRVQELEKKLTDALAKNAQLAAQMKAGSAKWDQLVARVKAQNDKIANFSEQEENERRRLTQLLDMEKARVSVISRDKDEEITRLKHDLMNAELTRYKTTPEKTPHPAPVTAAPTTLPGNTATVFDRAQKQREQLAEMLRQSQARLARDKGSKAPLPANNVQPIKAAPRPALAKIQPEYTTGTVPQQPSPVRGTTKIRSY